MMTNFKKNIIAIFVFTGSVLFLFFLVCKKIPLGMPGHWAWFYRDFFVQPLNVRGLSFGLAV